MDRIRLRAAVEATRLGYGLTRREVHDLVLRASALRARGVCIPPAFVPQALAARATLAAPLEIVTVANFPTGDHPRSIVRRVVTEAIRAGADHVDVVAPGSLVADRDWTALTTFLRRLRSDAAEAGAPRPVAVKVILETAAWDEERIRGAAASAIEADCGWLKTSTGFHPAGGATLQAVRLLRSLAPPSIGVKASGGIRTRETALAMLDAGADRIGTSSETWVLAPSG